MSILIRGMEMPTDCAMLLKIFPDGRVGVPVHLNWMGTLVVNDAEAVPVPPHGRLGDMDELAKEVNHFCDQYDAGIISTSTWVNGILYAIFNAPTIIPASKEGET